eukprot:TRINITY_DN2792_c0_g1_i1.p1 TRINITY_DN2792_c0_g1~~TRINITY_DN2792_c0_g1_i1.p1  ORF type:complete len:221 (+),score=35.69 TRINITY_DN2792_c0_g1_i1:52-714(+)
MMLASILLLLLVSPLDAFYFTLIHQKKNCFVAEAPAAKTGIQVKWEFKHAPPSDLVVATAADTRKAIIFTENLKGESGVLTVNTRGDPGSYHLCFLSNIPSKELELKISIYVKPSGNKGAQRAPAVDFKKGKTFDKSEYYPTISDIRDFEDDMSDIEELMQSVFSAAETFRANQEQARQLSQKVDTEVWWFGFLQVVLCVALTAYQSISIKNLLLEKKLV